MIHRKATCLDSDSLMRVLMCASCVNMHTVPTLSHSYALSREPTLRDCVAAWQHASLAHTHTQHASLAHTPPRSLPWVLCVCVCVCVCVHRVPYVQRVHCSYSSPGLVSPSLARLAADTACIAKRKALGYYSAVAMRNGVHPCKRWMLVMTNAGNERRRTHCILAKETWLLLCRGAHCYSNARCTTGCTHTEGGRCASCGSVRALCLIKAITCSLVQSQQCGQ